VENVRENKTGRERKEESRHEIRKRNRTAKRQKIIRKRKERQTERRK
jgi:hypothetical protein